jgi:hypothetical protein
MMVKNLEKMKFNFLAEKIQKNTFIYLKKAKQILKNGTDLRARVRLVVNRRKR